MILEPFNFYLQDRGSKRDTYQKLSNKIPRSLKADQQFLLGDDFLLNVLEVKHAFNNAETETKEVLDDSLFNRTMKKLMVKEKVNILGTGYEYLYHLESSIQNVDEDPELKNVLWNNFFDLEIPYVKLELIHTRQKAHKVKL